MPSALELKEEGNGHFAAKRFQKAIESYGAALSAIPAGEDAELRATLFSNRAQAHLGLKQNEEAVKDAREATQIRPDWSKAFTRLSAALTAVKDFDGAAEAAERALSLEPSSTDLQKAAKAAAEKARQAKEEEQCRLITPTELLVAAQQKVDVDALRRKAEAPGAVENLQERFIKPKEASSGGAFTVQSVPAKGRGVVAARDIIKGEAVLEEHALAWYPSFGDLIGAAIPGLLEVLPSFSKAGGDPYAVLSQLEPFASSFASSSRSSTSMQHLTKAEIAMRVSRQNGLGASFDDAAADQEQSRIVCFCPCIAMLNHDCGANARVTFMWDSRADAPRGRVFATEDIKKGEEITIRYCDGSKNKLERQESLKRYDFGKEGCRCLRCTQPFEDTVVFCCPECGQQGRIFGDSPDGKCDNPSCGFVLPDRHVVTTPLPGAASDSPAGKGGLWFQARTRYLATIEAGMNSYPPAPTGPDVTIADREAAMIPRVTVLDLALKHSEPEFLAKHHLSMSDTARLSAIYTSLGKGAWLLDASQVLKAYQRFLPYFLSIEPSCSVWEANQPQLNILAGHIAVAASDLEAAKSFYGAALELYKAFFGEDSGHPFVRITASAALKTPKNRGEVERFEVQRLNEGSWCAMGLSRRRAGKWMRPLELQDGGVASSSSTSSSSSSSSSSFLSTKDGNVAAGDERRLIEELQRITARVLGTKLGQSPLVPSPSSLLSSP